MVAIAVFHGPNLEGAVRAAKQAAYEQPRIDEELGFDGGHGINLS